MVNETSYWDIKDHYDVAVVLLNYQTYEDSIKYVDVLENQKEVSILKVVVDNFSPNGSYNYLVDHFKNAKDVVVLKTAKNGGYSYGNNQGVFFVKEHNLSKKIIISNTDLEINDPNLVRNLLGHHKNLESPAAISPVMKIRGETSPHSALALPTFWSDLTSSVRFLDKIFPHQMAYKFGEKPMEVGSLPGSFFLIDLEVFEALGFFDDEVFLYGEERILGWKVSQAGYKNYIIPSLSYVHENSKTISQFINLTKKQRLIEKSRWVYHKKYRKTNFLALATLGFFYQLRKVEDTILSWIKRN